MASGSFKPLETTRLRLRPPREDDAAIIFQRYSSVAEVVRYVGWPQHTSIDDTRQFLVLSHAEWERWPAAPLLIEDRATGELIGSSDMSFETAYRAPLEGVVRKHVGFPNLGTTEPQDVGCYSLAPP
jgi:RimJ/RimL family protein N-acetyltransferase